MTIQINYKNTVLKNKLTNLILFVDEKFNIAGLKKYISFNKGCYVGQEVITRLDSYAKVQNKLVLIKADKQIETDLTFNDANIGKITSHTSEDYLNGVYKLAYIKKKFLNDNHDSFEIQNTVE